MDGKFDSHSTVFQAESLELKERGNSPRKRLERQGQIMAWQRISPQSNHITKIKELHHRRDSTVTPKQTGYRSWLGRSSYWHLRK
ncbi:hypothetical protein AVEN_45764-1 [Araneus ventricosus]|uniref:Uncharacterized protein n=1 Tax=Araneus ventricosus TaxID=182803 RepID=A0A4Y2VS11_ARAVE|nr:hypothetical protein AVEN_223695-1 [Araneus ventricosus]GBO33604.1 hypothetical protein AVEN_45764-1 [Araneus ventricosus]